MAASDPTHGAPLDRGAKKYLKRIEPIYRNGGSMSRSWGRKSCERTGSVSLESTATDQTDPFEAPAGRWDSNPRPSV